MTSNDDPGPGEDEEQPPAKAMFHIPRTDAAGEPPVCPQHPEVKPRRVLRARWFCPACARNTPAA